jgi:hypothetical protein
VEQKEAAVAVQQCRKLIFTAKKKHATTDGRDIFHLA